MSFKEIVDLLVSAKRPIDVFGDGDVEEVKKRFRAMVKICHPDLALDSEKELAEKTMKILNDFYKRALDELKKGIYEELDEKELLKKSDVLFDFSLRGKEYKFYKYLASEDICDLYLGLCDDELVILKIAMEEDDNKLVSDEYGVLQKLDHLSIPKVLTRVKINGKEGLIFNKPVGLTIGEVQSDYGNINGEHICWILERLLSVVGYLHSQYIVHGNIKEDNVLIDVDNHNVILKDYTLCVSNANDSESTYRIINDDYTPSYVSKDARVMPNVDIYAIGKIAIKLLGGDVSNVALPVSCDIRVRNFIRKLLDKSANDAWQLWDELIKIRQEVYGSKRFQKLEKRRRK